jgi:hypothetical protein
MPGFGAFSAILKDRIGGVFYARPPSVSTYEKNELPEK